MFQGTMIQTPPINAFHTDSITHNRSVVNTIYWLVTFSNGEIGVYDCTPLLTFGVFQELQEKSYFKQVKVLDGTVVWPHEQDICPDTLYLASEKEMPNRIDATP